MNTEQEDIDLIEKFLKGELTHDEAMNFETRLEEDHEFARKLRLRKTFPSLFKAEGMDEIVMDVQEARVKTFSVDKFPKKTGLRILWVVLALMAIAISGFLVVRFLLPGHESSGQANMIPAYDEKKTTELKTAAQTSAEKKPGQAIQGGIQTAAGVQAAKTPATAVRESTNKPIELLLPVNNEVVSRGQDVVFRWRQKTDSFTNFYLISEANNKLAWWRGIKPGIREVVLPAINFKSGKFYWYVGSKEYRRTLIVADI
ncbi:MAG: hypothetical protein NTW31_14360 [Bacteroidetes bacterium]|nr:hypothetical protein [Bacteroidota bacterium]